MKAIKNILILTALTSMGLSGCAKDGQNDKDCEGYGCKIFTSLKIACPSGAPSVCLYKYVSNEDQVEVRSPEEASGLAAYMATNQKDVIILPTNAGVQQIVKNNANYKIAANITFGNLFIAATGNDDDNVMNDDDYVVLIQKDNVPDKLFQYVYGHLNLTNVHYLNLASSVKNVAVSGTNSEDEDAVVDYVLIPEPAFTAAKSQNPNISQYASLQEEYKNKSENKEITQASVFVSNTADQKQVENFLEQLEKDINEFVANPDTIDEYVKDFDNVQFAGKFGVGNATMLKNLTKNGNRMGVGFKRAKTNKANVDQFLTMWPAIGVTSEEIYY